MSIPDALRSLFWDVDVQTFEPREHAHYTIARVLEHGSERHVAWLLGEFSVDRIKDVLRTERRLSPRSATFFSLIFHVPIDQVAALTE